MNWSLTIFSFVLKAFLREMYGSITKLRQGSTTDLSPSLNRRTDLPKANTVDVALS
nr:uncharacterized protein LOC118878824 [Drosophila suzukii]XP_036677748.1 uncharacterized protein LOC118878824 [Drosophila suzukii]